MFLMTGLEFIFKLGTLRRVPRPSALAPRGKPRFARPGSSGPALSGERATAPSAEIAVGRRIVNREVVGGENPESPFRAGELVHAYSLVAGQGAGFVEHVWTCEGVEVARHYLPVGRDRRWRTWSRHRLQAGDYVVEVFAPDGRSLARHAFTSFPSATRRS